MSSSSELSGCDSDDDGFSSKNCGGKAEVKPRMTKAKAKAKVEETKGGGEISNYTEMFERKLNKKKPKHEIQNEKFGLRHPFRLGVVGGSGAGKTTAVCELILKLVKYEHLYIYARDLEEPIYAGIMATLDEIAEKNHLSSPLYTASDNPDDIIDVASMDAKVRSVMLLDDMVSSPKARPLIFEHFLRGRKKNCSYIFISQSYFSIQRQVRLQLSSLILMKLNDNTEIERIASMVSTDIPKTKFMKLYRKCVRKPFGFVLYDIVARDLAMKYRCGFYQSLVSDSTGSDSE